MSLSLASCAEVWPLSRDEREYPYRLQLEESLPHRHFAWDLDGDGRHETVRSYRLVAAPGKPDLDVLVVYRSDGFVVDQVNFHGRIHPPHFLDIDLDGVVEILAPLVRGDSLFATVVNGDGRKVRSLFVVSGSPRREIDGDIPWDPIIFAAFATDVNADGRLDLVTVLNTGYARLPRGVFAHDLVTGEPLGQLIIGAPIFHAFLDDFDLDGDKELVLGTVVTRNGAVAGGIDDDHQYFLVVELNGGPRLSLKIDEGSSVLQASTLHYGDFDGDGTREFVSVVAVADRTNAAVKVIRPGSWRVERERELPLQRVVVSHSRLDHDLSDDLLALGPNGEVMVLNGALDVVRGPWRLGAAFDGLEATGDLDGDGVSELVGSQRGHAVIFSATFSPLASVTIDTTRSPVYVTGGTRPTFVGYIKRDAGPARLLLYRADRTDVMRLVQNRFYLVFRYRLQLSGFGIALLALAVLLLATRLHRRNRLLRHVQALALEQAPSGFLLLQRSGRLAWANITLREWLGIGNRRLASLSESLAPAPFLVETCAGLLAIDPPSHFERTGTIGSGRSVRLFAEPIDPRGSRADWFVRIEDAAQQEGPSESLTWALLAERVTHDLKTPLNNMRLILWNLKTQLKSLAPAAAPQLDGFVDSVEIEVNHARRLSTNFMKLLRSEEARLEVLTLHELVAPCADQLQSSMPRDIELRLRSIPGEPLVRGDREQLQSVLENLLSNAVNAMPDGGVVTITTGYSRARFDTGATGFAECALIEVADTGKGITPELLPRVFEPGVTTRPLGSGVGLAVAKRAVTNHGGRIELQSELGIGTVLSIYLPLAPPSPGSLASERSTPLGQIKD